MADDAGNTALACPHCGARNVRCTDSRAYGQGAGVRRRRTCGACGSRWATYEVRAEYLRSDAAARVDSVSPLDRRLLMALVERFLQPAEVTTMISLSEQIRCVEREIGLRVRTYPRLVQSGRLADGEATRQLEAMRAVLDTLKQLRETAPQAAPEEGEGHHVNDAG